MPTYQVQPTPFAGQAPPPAAPKQSSARVGILIAVGITLTLVVLAGALFALFSTLSNSLGNGNAENDPPVVPETEAACDGCVTLDEAFTLRADDIPSLGLLFDEATGYAKPSIIGAYADNSAQGFTDGGGTPSSCSFMIDYGPVAPGNPGEANRTDRVGDLGNYQSDTDYVSQVVRVFESLDDAASYPDALRAGVAGCPQYSVAFTDADGRWSTDVTPVEFTTSSPAVTATGWTEEAQGYRLTIVDLQYANLAVRTIYNRNEDSAVTDEQIAAFVLGFSGQLEGLG